jgi:hypothetical protein
VRIRDLVRVGKIRDACAELLHVAGEGRAAAKLALTPAAMLMASEASARRARPDRGVAFGRFVRDVKEERRAARMMKELKELMRAIPERAV